MQAKVRPDSADLQNLIALINIFNEHSESNIAFIVTHCDEDERFTMKHAVKCFEGLVALVKK